MADETAEQDDAPKKKSKLPLIVGLVLMLALGSGGFFAVYSGMILAPPDSDHAGDGKGGGKDGHDDDSGPVLPLPKVAFVPLDPLVINLGRGSENRHLRFRAQLEVAPEHEAEVTKMIPRILDVLNSYLRAVNVEDLEDPTALIRIRAQMLRRVKIVTGEGRVRDLLVMEFVLS